MQNLESHRLPSLEKNSNSLINSYNMDAILELLKTKIHMSVNKMLSAHNDKFFC